MDPATFESFKQQLSKESFSSGKHSVVKTFTDKYFFNGPQVSQTLKLFSFNSDQLKFLEAVESRMMPLNGQEGKDIVLCFVHAGDKLKAVDTIADHIYDPTNKYDVLEAIDFKFDKEKARARLDKAVFKPTTGCPTTCPTSCPPGHYPPGPPGQYHPGPPGPPGQYPPGPPGQYQYTPGPPGQYPPGPPGQYPPGPPAQYPPGPPAQYSYPPGPPGQYPPPPGASGQYPPGQYGGQYPVQYTQQPQYPPGQYPFYQNP